jgi:hypothetical protein
VWRGWNWRIGDMLDRLDDVGDAPTNGHHWRVYEYTA